MWLNFDAYIKAEKFVKNLLVVNDVAERGIKLIGDFMHNCKNEEDLDSLAQLVEFHRGQFTGRDLSKSLLQSNL